MARILLIILVLMLNLAVLAAGSVWAQTGNYRHDLTIYDDGQGNNLQGPAGVTCDADRIIISDTRNSRLLLYTVQEGIANLTREIKLVRQIRPIVVQIGADDQLLVYDSRAKEILRFDTAGNRIGKVESGNVPSGSRIIPKSFRVDGAGNIYLLDVYGRRVVVLDPTGNFIRQIAFPEEFGFFSDLAVDDSGRVFILDSVRPRVFVAASDAGTFTPLSENLKEVLVYPTHMEVDSRGFLYIVDEETSTIGVLRRDGSFAGRLFNRGRKEGLLYYPSQICVGDGSQIVIADRDNNRVQVFREKE
jgi:DNA-binding beta-propeller fold protein YncE